MFAASCLAALVSAQNAIRLEAEDGQLAGVQVASSRKGFSGSGYVEGFDQDGDRISWSFSSVQGIYVVRIRYCVPGQNKGFGLSANGFGASGMFPPTQEEFVWHDAGRVELKTGQNTLVLEKGWGYYEIDAIEVSPAPEPPALKPVPNTLSVGRASPEAARLFTRLTSIYGKATLGGQYGEEDSALVEQLSGRLPAVLGGDLMDYSPSRVERGADPKNETERLIAQHKKGAVIALSWHWNAPKDLLDRVDKNEKGEDVDKRWYKGFYTNATTFDLAKAMANRESEEFRLLIRDIDAIAVELKKFKAAKTPVLWRPLHEAEGKWFWWGAKGPEPCIALWKLMHDRLTKRHGLDNLIWVWNSIDPAWYPGDDTVDMVGADLYPSDTNDANAAVWDGMLKWLNGRKMIALTEIGGVPNIDRAWKFGVRWLYFASWTGPLGPKKNKPGEVKTIYTSPRVITRDEWASR